MSTKTVSIGALPVRLPEGQRELTVQLNDPGIVRSVAWALEQRLVMTRGDAQFSEVLTLFVEFSPTGPKRNRRFLVLATAEQVGVPDGHVLEFVGSAVSTNSGAVAHVYEVKEISAPPARLRIPVVNEDSVEAQMHRVARKIHDS